MSIDNKKISSATRSSITQVKRWAVAFLGTDPDSSQYTAKARQYTPNEAIKIALGGYFVKTLRFKIAEAQKVLAQIEGWLPLIPVKTFEGFSNTKDNFIIHIIPSRRGHFLYDVKHVFSSEERPNKYDPEGPAAYNDWYVRHRFGDWDNFLVSTSNPREGLPTSAPHFRVPISELVWELTLFLGR